MDPEDSSIPVIDVVITWAGLNALDHRNKRIRNDNYEIKYCLRSIYQYIPWFHHKFLVVNNRTFYDIMSTTKTFIDSSLLHQHRITIINLVDLYCSIYSQCDALEKNRNSDSIETVLYRIPDLAQHYIYFNDDFMIGRPLHWTFFFAQKSNEEGRYNLVPRMPYMLYQTYNLNANNWYYDLWNYVIADFKTFEQESNIFIDTYQCLNVSAITRSITIDDIPDRNINSRMRHFYDHMPRPTVKRSWIQFEEEYSKWFAFVRSHKERFDSCSDGRAIGREESMPLHFMKRVVTDHRHDGNLHQLELDLLYYPIYDDLYFNVVIQWIANYFIERNYYHYWVFGKNMKDIETLKYHLNYVTNNKPPTFCLNDAGQKWKNNKLIQRFCKNYFPKPSPIEHRS